MKHEAEPVREFDIIDALDRLGKEGRGNGTAALTVTKYANVPEGALSIYGPICRQQIDIFVSLGRGRSVSATGLTVQEAFRDAERQVKEQRDPLAKAA